MFFRFKDDKINSPAKVGVIKKSSKKVRLTAGMNDSGSYINPENLPNLSFAELPSKSGFQDLPLHLSAIQASDSVRLLHESTTIAYPNNSRSNTQ
jgi:hypothetical protein